MFDLGEVTPEVLPASPAHHHTAGARAPRRADRGAEQLEGLAEARRGSALAVARALGMADDKLWAQCWAQHSDLFFSSPRFFCCGGESSSRVIGWWMKSRKPVLV